MSNVAMGLDDTPSSEALKDEDGDGLHSLHYGEKVSSDEVLAHGNDSSRKKARHQGPAEDSFNNGYASSNNMKGMHGLNVLGLHGSQHGDPNIIPAMADVHGNGNAELGQSIDMPMEPFVFLTGTHVESLPIQSFFHSSGEHEHGSTPADAALSSPTILATDGTFHKQFGENMVAFNGAASHESPKVHSHLSYKTSNEIPNNGNVHGSSQEHVLHGLVDIPESPTAYNLSGWYANHNGLAGLNSQMGEMHAQKPPYEGLPASDSIGGHTDEKVSVRFGLFDSSATGHTIGDRKGESPQLSCQDAFENYGNGEDAINYKFSNNAVETFVPEGSSMCTQLGGEDLKVNLEHMAPSNHAQNLPAKTGSIFSGSSYHTSQSGYMKNLALILRLGSAIFSLIAFSVIISTNEKRVAAGSTFYVKFSDYQAYNYLAALNLLTFLYSSGQLILLAQGRTNRILSSPIKWGASVYLCDQVLALLMVSSSSSAATASQLARHGLHNIWPPACSTWKLSLFCSRADVAVGMSFVSCLAMFLSTFFSGYHLSNLLAE